MVLALCLTAGVALGASQPPGRGGPGGGRGRNDPAMKADQTVFQFLLSHHEQIRRTITDRPDGVETLTESDDPAVAAKIVEHV